MTRTMSEIAQAVRQSMESLDVSPMAHLFAAEAVYELLFAPPGTPQRVEGRDAVVAALAAGGQRAEAIGLEKVQVTLHETVEPGFVIELTAHGRSPESGERYSFPSSIGVLTIQDGQITSYRDYPNFAGAAVALGTTSETQKVFDKFLSASVNNRWDELADLYADDAVVEMPFAPAGVPQRAQGRELLRERFAGAAGARRILKADNVIVHETADPDVIVTEFDLHSELSATGTRFSSTYIMVITVRDGEIVHSRDYSNSAAVAKLVAEIKESQTGLPAE